MLRLAPPPWRVGPGGRQREGVGFGLGLARYKNTGAYAAVVAEVEAAERVRCRRLWVAGDVGEAVNPDGVANQFEGGAVHGASVALLEEARFDRRAVTSDRLGGLPDPPLLRGAGGAGGTRRAARTRPRSAPARPPWARRSPPSPAPSTRRWVCARGGSPSRRTTSPRRWRIAVTRLSLTLACTASDRTRPVLDGRVSVPGVDLVPLPGEPEDIFRRALRDRAFDVSELSMGSHIVTTARGDSPYIGVPVFPSRAFRHSAVYIRTDRGIAGPADLAGRTHRPARIPADRGAVGARHPARALRRGHARHRVAHGRRAGGDQLAARA